MSKIAKNVGSEKKPPSGNTGVVNTRSNVFALIDWVSFTISECDPDKAIELLGLEIGDFMEMPKGRYGYFCHKRLGHIGVFSEGKENMGVHVEITGKGCRELEGLKGDLWQSFFEKVLDKGHFTRLDVAIDDKRGVFSIEDLYNQYKRGGLVSKFRKVRMLEETEISTVIETGRTLYFGHATSDVLIRAYDKGKQMQQEEMWNRFEIQARNERAQALGQYIASGQNIGSVASKVIRHYVKFVDSSEDSNKARWEVSAFWSDFLGVVDGLSLVIKKAEKTIEQTIEWVKKQVAPAAALIIRHFKGDMSFFDELIFEGSQRLKPRHLALLNKP